MVTVAIIGSRDFNNRDSAEKKILEIIGILTKEDKIITGDARGIDSWVKGVCVRAAFKCEIISPIDPIKKINFLYRNIEIITKADKIYAFWDGHSRGTKFVIDYAKARNKPMEVIVQ